MFDADRMKFNSEVTILIFFFFLLPVKILLLYRASILIPVVKNSQSV